MAIQFNATVSEGVCFCRKTHPETIVSRLSKKLGGRLAYSKDSYRTIGASEKHIDIIRKGYKPTWDKYAPWQRVAPSNLPSLPKPPMFLIQKLLGFSRKEPFMRWARYKDSMLVHSLQYLNLREFLTNGDLS